MPNLVKIILDNCINDVCNPGQTISGRVECFFNIEKMIKAIKLQFKGKAKTKWIGKHGKISTTYSAEELYFNEEVNLVSGEGGDDIHVEGGRHSYPFSYTLPQTLPSSFQGQYGRIKYTIKAIVDRPLKLDYEEKVILHVYSPLDLNTIPGIQDPYDISLDKEVSSGCCSTDQLTFNISLPATGFVAGEDMDIDAYISNKSNVNVESVQFRILQMLKYIAHHPSSAEMQSEFAVTMCLAGTVAAHSEKEWTSTVTIPSANYRNLTSCSIMNATYHVEAEVVLPFPHSNLTHRFPITIGTVPLSGINMRLPGLPSSVNPTAPSISSIATDVITYFPDG